MTNGVDTTLYYTRQEDARRRVMEGDLGPYILTYVADEDLPSVAGTTRYFGDEVHEARNTQEAYEYSSRRRLRRCVNMLRRNQGNWTGEARWV